jgi:predicted enzyme related to lactoylglutathione lyase
VGPQFSFYISGPTQPSYLSLTSFILQTPSDPYSKFGFWIPVTDPDRARAFYTAVFDWKCKEKGSASLLEGIKEIYAFTKGGALYGCFFITDKPATPRPEDSPIGVHNVFSVKDIEESLELIEKNGGKIHAGKTSIGPLGFMARFVDTEGNIMGIYAPN